MNSLHTLVILNTQLTGDKFIYSESDLKNVIPYDFVAETRLISDQKYFELS